MQCPRCNSTHIRKNGIKRGKQNNICVDCRRQFIDVYETTKAYSDQIKRECLKMYTNGMGFPGIERVKGVDHTTIIHWVKQIGQCLSATPEIEEIPEVSELDELETFVAKKTQNLDLDGREPLPKRYLGVDDGRSEAPKRLNRYGNAFEDGKVISTLPMGTRFIPCL